MTISCGYDRNERALRLGLLKPDPNSIEERARAFLKGRGVSFPTDADLSEARKIVVGQVLRHDLPFVRVAVPAPCRLTFRQRVERSLAAFWRRCGF